MNVEELVLNSFLVFINVSTLYIYHLNKILPKSFMRSLWELVIAPTAPYTFLSLFFFLLFFYSYSTLGKKSTSLLSCIQMCYKGADHNTFCNELLYFFKLRAMLAFMTNVSATGGSVCPLTGVCMRSWKWQRVR